MKKILLSILALILGVLFLTSCSSNQLSNVRDSGTLKVLGESNYDWGDINIKGGDVAHTFKFKNDSQGELVLKGLVTSCMCTTAQVKLQDGTFSPKFGMHENSEWAYALKPGEEFDVEIIFDPMAHGPDAVGPIQREITLFSSSKNGDLILKLSANVLSEEEFNTKYGESVFMFKEKDFDFGMVKQSGGIVLHDFEFVYLGEEAITITSTPTSCACTSAKLSKNTFSSGEKGILTVSFDPNLHEEPEDKFYKTVSLITDPKLETQPEIKIWADVDLDLGPDAYKQKQHID